MRFRRLSNVLGEVVWGGVTFKGIDVILVQGSAHCGLVKVGNSYTATEYTHVYPSPELLKEIYASTVELSLREIRRLRHHMTNRIWMLDGVFECIEWQKMRNKLEKHGCKLLPAVICQTCLREGNKFVSKSFKTIKKGKCRCCGQEDIPLTETRYGWPLDLRHRGFGFTVIGTGINYTNNVAYYNHHYDMSIYKDYTGEI